MKKKIAILLAVCLLACLLPVQAASDITDPAVQQSVDTLSSLGVLTGYPDGTFRPDRGLTRAEFCTIAVKSMGATNALAMYENRTIFPDVRANHWARSYINYAVAGEKKIIAGMPDGSFAPDSPVTYGQAITILVRMLGYSDSDAGMLWPQGYLALAAKLGLSDAPATGAEPISRGTAATLFAKLLVTDQKDGKAFAETLGTLTERTVLLSVDSTGAAPLVKTAGGTYEAASATFPSTAVGRKGRALLNEKGQILTFLPENTLQKAVSLVRCNATWLTTEDGTRYTIESATPVYDTNGLAAYSSAWVDFHAGDLLTLYLEGDRITGIFRGGAVSEQAVVVRGSASAELFGEITGGASEYVIFKNGRKAELSDLKPYDVATYENGVLRICSSHLTGFCEKMLPNEQSPLSVTVYGHTFPVLYSAISEVAQFRVGDEITLLLTADGAVAGAVSPKTRKYDTIGIVTESAGASARVQLLRSSLVIESVRNPRMSGENADYYNYTGHLVRLYRDEQNLTRLTPVSSSAVPGTLQVQARLIGSTPIEPDCLLYDQAGNGPLKEIEWEDISRLQSVPVSKISYCRTNGQSADVIVLKNVTGNCYEYGFLQEGKIRREQDAGRPTVSLRSAAAPQGGTEYTYTVTEQLTVDKPAAIAPETEAHASHVAMLRGGEQVSRGDFRKLDDGTVIVTCQGKTYRVASDVQCCTAEKSWFSSLEEARGFAETLKIYRDPISDTVRIIIAG